MIIFFNLVLARSQLDCKAILGKAPAALLFCFEKMSSVVDIKFADESKNFDFENSGKSFRPHRKKWSMLYIAESDESNVESTESGLFLRRC